MPKVIYGKPKSLPKLTIENIKYFFMEQGIDCEKFDADLEPDGNVAFYFYGRRIPASDFLKLHRKCLVA